MLHAFGNGTRQRNTRSGSCGDFRSCPGDLVRSVSGRLREVARNERERQEDLPRPTGGGQRARPQGSLTEEGETDRVERTSSDMRHRRGVAHGSTDRLNASLDAGTCPLGPIGPRSTLKADIRWRLADRGVARFRIGAFATVRRLTAGRPNLARKAHVHEPALGTSTGKMPEVPSAAVEAGEPGPRPQTSPRKLGPPTGRTWAKKTSESPQSRTEKTRTRHRASGIIGPTGTRTSQWAAPSPERDADVPALPRSGAARRVAAVKPLEVIIDDMRPSLAAASPGTCSERPAPFDDPLPRHAFVQWQGRRWRPPEAMAAGVRGRRSRTARRICVGNLCPPVNVATACGGMATSGRSGDRAGRMPACVSDANPSSQAPVPASEARCRPGCVPDDVVRELAGPRSMP